MKPIRSAVFFFFCPKECRMKTILTVQHTQSLHHTNGMVGSWTDWPLTALGLAQAQSIGRRLAEEFPGRRFALYSSDLLRARQTAEAIGAALQVQTVYRQELRERNLGSACGRSVAWMHEHQTASERTVDDRLFPDAESRRDEWNRLQPFFDQLLRSDEPNLIVVSHGDLLSVFNTMFMGLPVESLDRFEAFGLSGGVSLLQVDDSGKRYIKKLSDRSYLL